MNQNIMELNHDEIEHKFLNQLGYLSNSMKVAVLVCKETIKWSNFVFVDAN